MLSSLSQQLLSLYGIIAVGFIAARIAVLSTEGTNALMRLVLSLTLPCLIISSLDTSISTVKLTDIALLLLLSSGILLFASGTAYIARQHARLPADCKTPYEGVILFGNQGFIGYAVCSLLLGQKGIVYAAIFNLPYLFLIWTYGIYIFSRQKTQINWQNIFLNPGVTATSLGIILLVTPLSLPSTIHHITMSIGAMTTPLSLLVIGGLLAAIERKSLQTLITNRYIWLAAFLKLIAIPALLLVMIPLQLPFIVLAVALLLTATPSAPTISLYALKYGGNAAFSSTAVAVSTIGSMLSIPLLYTVLQWLYELVP